MVPFTKSFTFFTTLFSVGRLYSPHFSIRITLLALPLFYKNKFRRCLVHVYMCRYAYRLCLLLCLSHYPCHYPCHFLFHLGCVSYNPFQFFSPFPVSTLVSSLMSTTSVAIHNTQPKLIEIHAVSHDIRLKFNLI